MNFLGFFFASQLAKMTNCVVFIFIISLFCTLRLLHLCLHAIPGTTTFYIHKIKGVATSTVVDVFL